MHTTDENGNYIYTKAQCKGKTSRWQVVLKLDSQEAIRPFPSVCLVCANGSCREQNINKIL